MSVVSYMQANGKTILTLGLLVGLMAWCAMNRKESYHQQPYAEKPVRTGTAASGGGPPILPLTTETNKIEVGGIDYPASQELVRQIPFERGRP
jgi:hypothetical protein